MAECRYCTGDINNRQCLIEDDDAFVSIFIDDNSNICDDYNYFQYKIKYCPMCGRKL